jgi:parallel beta-helix repeat protein
MTSILRARTSCAPVLAVAGLLTLAFPAFADPGASGPIGADTSQLWSGAIAEPTTAVTMSPDTYVAGLASIDCGTKVWLMAGSYTQPATVRSVCTMEQPVVIEPVSPFAARMSAALSLDGQYLVVSGIQFENGGGIVLNGKYVRATRNKVLNYSERRPIAIGMQAENVMVDRNLIDGYRQQGISVFTDPGQAPRGLLIQRNHIRNKLLPLAGVNSNLEEAIQIGEDGDGSLNEIHALVEWNLVENNLDSDDPISIKSSRNTVQYNYLRNTQAGIVLRNGRRNLVLGNTVADAAINVTGDNHLLIGNWVSQIKLVKGTVPDGQLTAKTGIAACASKNAASYVTLAGNTATLGLGVVSVAGCPETIYQPVHDIRIERHTGSVTQALVQQPIVLSPTTSIALPTASGSQLIMEVGAHVGPDATY